MNKRKGIFCLTHPAPYFSTPPPSSIAGGSGVVTLRGKGALTPALLVIGETIPALALHSADPACRVCPLVPTCERGFLVADLRPFGCGAYPPVWWGMLCLVVARPSVFLRIVGRGAAVLRPPSLFPSLAGGLVHRSGLGLPVSLFHGISIRPPTDLVALAMRFMVWCLVVCWRRLSL